MKTASAVLMALGLVSAETITLDVFHPTNFLKVDVAKELVRQVTDGSNGSGDVTYSQCDDDFGVFKFDGANTTPTHISKGSTIGFDLKGVVSAPIEVTDINVDVKWGAAHTDLFNHDYKQDNKYTQVYDYSDLKWPVPGFAPNGEYDVTITGTGSSGNSNGKVLCIKATFTF